MSRSLKEIVGYEAGRGKTFTPTVGAMWINDFLQIMIDSKKSRNEVTEMLISEALDARRGLGSNVESLNLTLRELEFLKTPVGRKIISDYSQVFYGEQAYQGSEQGAIIDHSHVSQSPLKSASIEETGKLDEYHNHIQKDNSDTSQPIESEDLNKIISEQDEIKARIKRELASISLKKENTTGS
jgi:hypothetical protein